MPSKRIFYALLVLLIVAGSCFRIFVCVSLNPLDFLLADPGRHWANGLRFPKGAYFGASDPIGYQVYIAALRRVTADNRLLVALASALMSVLMPWTYYRAARNFGLAKIASLGVWAFIVWTPPLLAIYHFIMMETLLLLLEGAALWATARHLRVGGSKAFLTSVLLWTAATLTKPTVLPLAAICILWSCWKKFPSLKTIGTAAVLVLVLLLPQAIRSYIALGFIAPFGNPWLTKIQHRAGLKGLEVNFYSHANPYFHFRTAPNYDMDFSSPSCYVRPLLPFSDWMIHRAASNSKLVVTINSQYGEAGWEDAYNSLNVGWREWLRQWRENIVLFLFAPSYPEHETSQWVDRLETEARWMWAPIVLLVILGNLRAFTKKRFHLIPVAVTCFTLFLALQNVVTFEGRYRKPLEPLLLLNIVWLMAGSARPLARRQEEVVPTAGLLDSADRTRSGEQLVQH